MFKFAVSVAPKIDPTQGGKADLKKGNDFKMTCKATGNPLPTVTWTRNGIIDPREQVRIQEVTNRATLPLHWVLEAFLVSFLVLIFNWLSGSML